MWGPWNNIVNMEIIFETISDSIFIAIYRSQIIKLLWPYSYTTFFTWWLKTSLHTAHLECTLCTSVLWCYFGIMSYNADSYYILVPRSQYWCWRWWWQQCVDNCRQIWTQELWTSFILVPMAATSQETASVETGPSQATPVLWLQVPSLGGGQCVCWD